MIASAPRWAWAALAGVLLIGAVTTPIWTLWIDLSVNSDSDGSVWGIFMGAGLYALINFTASIDRARRHLAETPSANTILARGLTMLALCLLGMGFLFYGSGVIPSERPPYVPNLAMLATMLSLSLLLPTPAQGFFLPAGDERFRQTQLRAMGLTLRATLAAILILGAWDHFAPIDLPLVIVLWGLLTVLTTIYNAALWWQER